MPTDSTLGTHIRTRILIADDSRLVRASLIKHIEGMFEFREALDGEHAWQLLLIDPSIRVVITDLSMPKLDGYGLLERIRSSRISRIRDMPIIVISGSDQQEERDRAKAAGATEMITKGIATAQLLSRLEILSRLVSTREELHRAALLCRASAGSVAPMTSVPAFHAAARSMLKYAVQYRKSFVLLHICIANRNRSEQEQEEASHAPASGTIAAIGQLLQCAIRQSDCVARTGDAEFTLVTSGIQIDSAHGFAQRICDAIVRANLPGGRSEALVVTCSLACLPDDGNGAPELDDLCKAAQRSARLGLEQGVFGVIRSEVSLGTLELR